MDQTQRNKLREEGYWVPNAGPQELALALSNNPTIFEVFFGGARGPGKTDGGLGWLTKDMKNSQMRALVIRKNSEDLSDWIDRARRMYGPLRATFTGKPVVGRVPSGSVIRSGHLKDDDAYTKYQGHEYHRMLIEELTQIPNEKRYLQLIASCRSTVVGLSPQVFITANPGGVGHLWVRKRFVDPDPNVCIVQDLQYHYIDDDGNEKVSNYKIITDRKTGMKRAYIPATLDDNPILKKNDPNYVRQLDALEESEPDLYKAWRFGDWDIFAGQVFKEWRPTKDGKPYHVIPMLPTYVDEARGQRRSILDVCQKYISLDWGYNDPTSIHWNAVSPEDAMGIKRYYTYREMSGTERTPKEWARDIAEVVLTEPIETLIMPHDTYSHLGGNKPIATQFQEVFDEFALQHPGFHISIVYGEAKSHVSKINRQALLHEMLAEAPDGLPYLQILSSCPKLIETLPALPYSESKPEEIDDKADDHYYDSETYGLYKILGGEAYVSPSALLQQTKNSFIIDAQGYGQGLTVDISKALRESSDENRDWRYQ